MNERTKERTNLNLRGVKNFSTKEEHFSLASLVRMLLSNFRDTASLKTNNETH